MKRVLCFGEILLRMSPSADQSWIYASTIPVYVGGAELNVATALAQWDVPVKYVTAVPENYLSESILSYVSAKGIDTRAVLKSGNRIGLYYLQQGTDLAHAAVIYDRANSSFSMLKPGMVDWDRTLDDVSFFHFSAISPALNENVAALCREAVSEAAKRNIPISVDLNYRASLWKDGRDPVNVMKGLVDKCTVIMGNIWSAGTLLGIPVDDALQEGAPNSIYREHARKTALNIMNKFPACSTVANTFRFNAGENAITYFATLDQAGAQYHSPCYRSSAIQDKVGSGDCFMAGLIYGNRMNLAPQDTINLAAKAALMKMHEVGDSTRNNIASIQSAIINHEAE
jgi:2-dehydro-3-deoxygluconokinase